MVKIRLQDIFKSTVAQRRKYVKETKAYEEEKRKYEEEKARIEAENKAKEEEYQRQLAIYKAKKARYNRAKRKVRNTIPVVELPSQLQEVVPVLPSGSLTFQTVETPSGTTTAYAGNVISTTNNSSNATFTSISKPKAPSTPTYSVIPSEPTTAEPVLVKSTLESEKLKSDLALSTTQYASIPLDDGSVVYKGKDYIYDKPPTKYEEVSRSLLESAKKKKGIPQYWEYLKSQAVSRYAVALPKFLKSVYSKSKSALTMEKTKDVLDTTTSPIKLVKPFIYNPKDRSLDINPSFDTSGIKDVLDVTKSVIGTTKSIGLSIYDRYKGASGKKKMLEDVTLVTASKTYFKALTSKPAETLASTTIFAGESLAPFVASKVISKGRDIFFKIGAKYVPESKAFAPEVISGKSKFPSAKSSKQIVERLKATKGKYPEFEGLYVTQSSTPVGTSIRRVATKQELGKLVIEDPILYSTTAGRGSPVFLRVADKLDDYDLDISLNPFKGQSKPTVYQIGVKGVKYQPKNVLAYRGATREQTFKATEQYLKTAPKEYAYITKRGMIGKGELTGFPKSWGTIEEELGVASTTRLEPIKTSLVSIIKPGQFKYTTYKGRTVPIISVLAKEPKVSEGVLSKIVSQVKGIKSTSAVSQGSYDLYSLAYNSGSKIPISVSSVIPTSSLSLSKPTISSSLLNMTMSSVKPKVESIKSGLSDVIPTSSVKTSSITKPISRVSSISPTISTVSSIGESSSKSFIDSEPIIPTPVIYSEISKIEPASKPPVFEYSSDEPSKPTYKLAPYPTEPIYPTHGSTPASSSYKSKRKSTKKKKPVSDKSVAYKIYVREKGVNKLIKLDTKTRNIYASQKVLSEILDKSTSRSGFLIKTNKKADIISTRKPNLNKFRSPVKRSKLFRTSFVEKSKYAIDTIGEKKGITYKGILANMSKSKGRKNSLKRFSSII